MKKQLIAAVVLAGSMITSGAYAENNGDLGGSSNGDVDVTLTVPELVQLTFPGADIDLTYTDGSDSIVTEEFCVYSNQASVDFNITVDPGNTPAAGTAPVMETVGGDELAYQIDLKKADGTNVSADIQAAGVTVNNQADANQASKTCASGGNSHEFTVTVLETDIESATDGAYSDTVSVTIAAN